ncbi:single-stranded DNA-binding protein [Morganella morganii]|uniref:single-stranded DNA-binding protein n=1 Tax=Morganella morganii TaxID=582 RepID=UPI00128CDE91|nr:single-stranded DNA-binding protein [Morganella morganii]MQC08049.1 single-stranded DNA-binding protein [Morganella morganii]MQC10096.1 single-stranded DNA-binding protein [Morganella morganii]MQC13239.1 single-stranded DNA-binding protein [Morganella morganii]
MAINVITVSGNLGKDCEQRWTPAGKAVASFSLPVKQGYGEHEKTSWVICKMFGAKAEKLPEHLKKGMKVTITGEFVMEEWTDREGNKRSTPVIIVNQLDFGGNQAVSQNLPQQQRTQQPPVQNEPPMDFDDDIPF